MEAQQPPPTSPPAGWYTDPDGSGGQRYWDGERWTDARSTAEEPPAPTATAQPQPAYVQQSGNGIAVAAMVCGIIGAVFGLIPLTYLIALALGIVALVLGIMGRRRAKKDPAVGRKGSATAGIVLGVIAIALGIAGAVIVEDAVNDLDEATEELEQEFDQGP